MPFNVFVVCLLDPGNVLDSLTLVPPFGYCRDPFNVAGVSLLVPGYALDNRTLVSRLVVAASHLMWSGYVFVEAQN